MISRLLKTIDLFGRILSLLYGSFAKETYNFKEPTHRACIKNIGAARRLLMYGVGWLRWLGSSKSQVLCRISSLLQGSFAKETYNFKEPTNRSHPIGICVFVLCVWVCSFMTCHHVCCKWICDGAHPYCLCMCTCLFPAYHNSDCNTHCNTCCNTHYNMHCNTHYDKYWSYLYFSCTYMQVSLLRMCWCVRVTALTCIQTRNVYVCVYVCVLVCVRGVWVLFICTVMHTDTNTTTFTAAHIATHNATHAATRTTTRTATHTTPHTATRTATHTATHTGLRLDAASEDEKMLCQW